MSLAGSISIAVGPSTKGFWTKFNADVKKNPPKVEVKVNPDLTRLRNEINSERKRQELNAVNLKVKLDQSSIRGVENQLRRVEHVWKGSAWSKAVKVNLYVAGAASLPSLISGLMSLTTAVTQLGRAALVLPGIFSGLAVSVGAFSTGIVGVAEAIKQSNNSLDNATQKARTYERATRDLERAQRDVVQALKDANREIEDQKNKLTNNQLSVEQAQLNLRKANKELSKGGFETNDDYRQAVLDQKRAQLELNDVVKQSKRDIQDYYDEAKKGATQSDTFKDSVDRLNTAVEDFTKTQTEAAGASEKFLQAMASLSPNAKDFVLQVLSMKSAWEGLQRGVSDKLFDGVGKAITDLAKTKLPMLRKGMQDVAAGLNNDIKGMISSIGKDANANSLSKIFERTAAALNIMKPGLDSMITGFMKLSEVGSRFLPRLASAFNLVADRFDKFIEKADKNGSLERWINQGLNLVSSLTRSVGYLGSIFGSITRSYEKATGNIGGFATTVEKQLKKWSDTLSSAAGQQKLTEWISKSKDFIATIKRSLPGIQNLFQALGDGARQFAKVAFPIFSALGNFLERNAILAENLFIMYAVMKTWKPIANIFSKIKDPLFAGIRETQAVMAARTAMNAQIRAQEKEREEAAKDRLERAKELRAIEDRNVVAAQRASASAQIEARTRATQGKLELKLAGDRLDAKKAELDAAKLQAAQSSEASVAMAKRSVGVAELQSGLTQNQGRIDLEQSARRIRAGEGELAALRRQAEQSAEAVVANRRNLNLISSIGVESDISNEPRGRGSTTRGAGGRFVRADDAAPRPDGDFYDAPTRTRGYYSQEEGRFVPLNSPATGFTDRIEELRGFRRQQAALVVDLEDQRNAILDAGRTAGGSSPQQLHALRVLSARITDEEANLQALNMAVNGQRGSLEEARRIAYDQTVSAQARQAQDVQNIAKLEEKLDSDRRKYGEHQSEVDRKNLDSKSRLKGSLDDLSVVQSGSSAAQIADLERVRRLEGEVDTARKGYANTQLSVSRTNLAANEKLRGSVNDLAIVQGKAKDAAKLQGEANAQVIKSMNTASEATNRLGGQGRFLTGTISRLEGRFPRLADSIDKTTRAIGVGGSGGRGLAGRLGGLLGLLGNTARAIAGVAGFAGTIGLMFALDKLADAHQKAGDRAEYQRSRLEALKNQVDPTTGAVTQAAIAEALDQAADFSVTGDENRKVKANPITAANKLGISTETLGSSLNPINLDAINKVQSTADKDTLAAIKSGKDEQWNRFGEQLQRNGVTPEIYAKAINGDQPSVAKFKAAEDGIFRDRNGGSLIDPFGLKRKAMGAVGDLPNLGTAAENLINAGVSGVSLGQYQRSSAGAFLEGGNDTRQARRPAVLKQGGPFTGAQDAKWQSDGSGVSFVMEGVDAAKQAALENLGATVQQTGNYGRVVVEIGGDMLTKYVEPARYAAGGSVWGMGSATSDSIPAMLSNGEFVINAKSASAIGHDKLNAMNDTTFGGGGRFSAGGIAHFAPGGPVPRKPPPIVPDIAPPSTDENTQSTPSDPYVDPVSKGIKKAYETINDGMWKVTDFFGDFLRGATGIGETPEGYRETSTAEVRLNPSPAPITMGALGTPFTKDTTRGYIPAFTEQVLENVYGGKIPEKGETRRFDYPADTPAVPGVPVPHGATNKPGTHLPVGQPGPGGPKSIPGIPGPLRLPAPAAPVAAPVVTNGRIPRYEQLPSIAGAAAPGLASLSGGGATVDQAKLNAFIASLKGRFGGTAGLSIAPLFGDNRTATTVGDMTSGPAWSTIKVAVAMAALREQGAVSNDIVAALTLSDNEAAERIFASLGDPATAAGKVQALLRASGDDSTIVNYVKARPEFSSFGQTDWSLENQVKFMSYLAGDPSAAPILELMGKVAPDQRWGVGTLGGSQYKGGWGPGLDGNYLSRQMGIIDGPGGKYAIALGAMPSDGKLDTANMELSNVASDLTGAMQVVPSATGPMLVTPNGGITFNSLAALADTLPYVYGGGHPGYAPGSDNPLVNGFDCSGLASYFANLATGRPLNSDIFGTSTQRDGLVARGFLEGPGGPNDLTIGWNPDHTAITIPGGTNVEAANSDSGILVGPGATGGFNFPPTNASGSQGVMHLPGAMINPELMSDNAPPLMPDISGLTPPPGAVTGPKKKKGEGGIPGINAPIPGPFGDLPIEPMDLLKQIGEAILTGILGFFGIDASSIIKIINDIFGGFPDGKEPGEGEGDPGVIDEENPNPQVDPGPDPAIVQQFVQAAAEAKARGDEPLARNLLQRARDYQRSRLAESAQPSTLGGLTLESSQVDVAKAILSEARSRGYSKEEAQAILSTAIGSSQLNPRGLDPVGNWTGIFPLAKLDGQQMPGAVDPNQNIASFFDGMDAQSGQGADIWQSIFYASGAPGAVYTQNDASKPRDPKMLEAALGYMQATGYAAGGMVRGPGTGTSDSIPAMLSHGEFVMRADAVNRLGAGNLQALNSGGLVRGYAPGGSVDAQGNTGFELLQAEALRAAFRGDPLKVTAPKMSFAENARSVWRDTGAAFSNVDKNVNAALPTALEAFAPLVGLGDPLRRHLHPEELGPSGIVGADEARRNFASNMARAVGAAPQVNNLLGINDDPRRRRNRFSNVPDVETGTASFYGDMVKAVTQYDKLKAGDTSGAIGSALGDVGIALLTGGSGYAAKAVAKTAVTSAAKSRPAIAAGSRLSAGAGEIKRSFGIGAGAAGAVPRASGAARRAALADVTLNTSKAGFYGRRQIRNAVADLMVAFPDVDFDRVSMWDPDQMERGFPDVKGAGKTLALSPHTNAGIILNTDFFGKGNLGKLRKDVRKDTKTGFTPGMGFRDEIFNIIAHEFGHKADLTTNGPILDRPDLVDSLNARIFRVFERDNPGIRNSPDMGNQAFADYVRSQFYDYSYYDEKSRNPMDFVGPDAIYEALDSLNRPEALANAFGDSASNGRFASSRSKELFDHMMEEGKRGAVGVGQWRDMRSISAYARKRGRGPGWGSGKMAEASLSPEALATKRRFAGPVSGAVGGDHTPAHALTDEAYNANQTDKATRRSKWFGLPGNDAQGEFESIIENILRRYNDTIGEKAWIRDSGMTWYSDAREWFTKLMDDSGVDWTVDQAGAALAALSGNTGWNANMANAIKFFRDTGSLDKNQPGYQTALRVIKSKDPMKDLGPGADKWRHFAASILGKQVDGVDPVAVDRWAMRAALGTGDEKLAKRATTRAINGVLGKTVVGDAYREAAKRAGINSEQMQAVVWMHSITPPEGAMWEDISKYIATKRWPWKDEVTFNGTGASARGSRGSRGGMGPGGPRVNQQFTRALDSAASEPGVPLNYWDSAAIMDNAYGIGVEDFFGEFKSDKVNYTDKQVAALRDYSRSSWTNKVMRGAEDLPGIQKVLSDLIAIRPKMSGAGGFRPGLVGESGVADVADLYGQIIGTPMLRPKRGVDFTKLKNQDIEQIDQLKTMLFGDKRRSVAEENADPFAPDGQTIIERITEMLQPARRRLVPNSISMESQMLEVLGRDASDEDMQYFLRQAIYADRSRARSAKETGPTTQQVWEDVFHGFLKEARLRATKTIRYQSQARLIESALGNGPGLPSDMWVTRMIEAGDPSLAGIGELSPANPGFSSTSVGISRSQMDNPKAWEQSPVFSDREVMQQILLRKGTPGVWMGGGERELITPRMMQFITRGEDFGRQVGMVSPNLQLVDNSYPLRKRQQRVYGEAVFPDVMPDLNDIGLDPLMELIGSLGLEKSNKTRGYDHNLDYFNPRGWQDLMAPAGNGGIAWDIGESDVEMHKLKFARGGHVRGPGSGTSDSIPAMLSHGEFVIKADAVEKIGVKRLNAMNSIPRFARFADGGLNLVPGLSPPIIPPGGPLTDVTDPALADPALNNPPAPMETPVAPGSPMETAPAGTAPMETSGLPPAPDAPDPNALANDPLSSVPDLNKVISDNPNAAAIAEGILGNPIPVIGGGSSAGVVEPQAINPRAKLGSVPTGASHINPALAGGIKGAISTIGNIAKLAAKAAAGPEAAAISAAGSAAGAALGGATGMPIPGGGDPIAAIVDVGTQVATDLSLGAANVISSLLVGTVTPSQTGQGYGAPMLPQREAQPSGSSFQSIHNGDVVTNNLSEYSRMEERKRAQREAPFMNRSGN